MQIIRILLHKIKHKSLKWVTKSRFVYVCYFTFSHFLVFKLQNVTKNFNLKHRDPHNLFWIHEPSSNDACYELMLKNFLKRCVHVRYNNLRMYMVDVFTLKNINIQECRDVFLTKVLSANASIVNSHYNPCSKKLLMLSRSRNIYLKL